MVPISDFPLMFIPPAMPSSPSSPELVHSEPNPNPIPEPDPNPEPNTSHNAPSSPPQTTANKPPPTAAEIAARYILQSPPLSFPPKPLTTSEVTSAFGVVDDLPSLTVEEPKPLTSILTTSSGDQFSGTSWWNKQLETGISALADLANPSYDEIGYQGYSIHSNLASYNNSKPFEFDNGGWSPVDYGYNFNNFFATASSPRSPSSKLVGAGITNMGNTCFMSAILQCFTHTVQMFLGLRYCTHASSCDVKGFCVICAFRNLFDDALNPSKTPVVPRDFAENLDYFIAGYVSDTGKEEDAHEFLQCAMKELQKRFPVGEENLIDQVFGGSFVNTLRCCLCGRHSSATFLPFTDMSLEIEHAASIPHALKSITRAEQLDGKFRCTDCNQEVTMEKQRMLDKAPSVAVFHLKRFLKDGDSFKKIERSLWLHKNLNLNPYTSGSSTDNVLLKYELYAVVAHRGPSPNSGHYFCFVRSAPDEWYLMDDDKVSSVSEKEALNRRAVNHKAYILFYAKEGTPLFSSILEKDDNDTTADPDEKDDDDNNGAEDDNDSADASYNLWFKMGERSAQDELCECYNM